MNAKRDNLLIVFHLFTTQRAVGYSQLKDENVVSAIKSKTDEK